MSTESSFSRFVSKVKAEFSVEKAYSNEGRSNRGRFIEGGMFLLEANLNSLTANLPRLGLFSRFAITPDCTAYFGIIIEEQMGVLYERLRVMRESGESEVKAEADAKTDGGGEKPKRNFSDENKHVEFLVIPGVLYLQNRNVELARSDWEPTLCVEKFVYAIEDRGGTSLTSVAWFVGEVSKLIPKDRIIEIKFDGGESIPDTLKIDPAGLSWETIAGRISKLGKTYPNDIVQALHNGLTFQSDKHFAILAGLSGSGKTSLALRYAAAIHDQETLGRDTFTTVCPVRPDWKDPTGLLGYRDVFTKQYVVPQFLAAVLRANSQPNIPIFVILDEMNLAMVEYYFAPMLSCMETRLPLHLHNSASPIPSEAGLEIPPAVDWPENLYIIGTINVDETTNHLSPKVIDRAVLIDTTDIDVAACLTGLRLEPALQLHVDEGGPHLVSLYGALKEGGSGFGYRTIEEIIRYLARVRSGGIGPSFNEAFDALLLLKLIPKLRGTERQRNMLVRLSALTKGFPKTNSRVEELISDLDDGAFDALR
jgi:5-methylcytosine-specific restriction protein B